METQKKRAASNRKIINATPMKVGKIQFKSTTEARVYKTLKESGFDPKYEPVTFTIWKGFYPTVPFLTKDKKGNLVPGGTKLQSMHYTPDFIMKYKGYTVIVEVKGFENDVFPYKFKIFRKYMETHSRGGKVILAMIYSKKMALQLADYLKTLK